MWSLLNLGFFYPALIEGFVHDRDGTTAMLLTDALLGAAGFAVLMVGLRVLGSRAPTNERVPLQQAALPQR